MISTHFPHARAQRGVSLGGLIFVLVILGLLAVLAMKIVPVYLESREIHGAAMALTKSASVREVQMEFNKRASVAGITSIRGEDLTVVKNGDQFDISYAYEKKIPLAGPASLLLEFAESTNPNAAPAAEGDTAEK